MELEKEELSDKLERIDGAADHANNGLVYKPAVRTSVSDSLFTYCTFSDCTNGFNTLNSSGSFNPTHSLTRVIPATFDHVSEACLPIQT